MGQDHGQGHGDGTEIAEHDVVVIGGGPAGTTAAILLAQAGHDVALYEALDFPRVHVGESLIPAANRTLERIGVRGELDKLSCPPKFGVQFYSQRGAGRPFYFSEASDPELHQTWQVRRSEFDAALLERAGGLGVAITMRTQVRDVIMSDDVDGDGVDGVVRGVTILGPDGIEKRVRAKAVLDASGQRGLLARRFGVREHIDGLANTAAWAHFEGARLDDGIDGGSTLIYRIRPSTWLWFIPLPDSVSIGVVTPVDEIASFGHNPVEVLDAALEACEQMHERLENAKRVSPVRLIQDFSYRATRDGGKGWALIGDALGFMDPVYSSGLYLALHSAELAADRVIESFAAGTAVPDLEGFSTAYQEAFEQFLVIVRAFYREDFHFGEFARSGDRRKGLVDLFTGDVMSPQAIEVANAIRAECALPSRHAS